MSVDISNIKTIGTIKYQDYAGNIKEIDVEKSLAFSSDDIPYETQAIKYYMVGQLMNQLNREVEDVKLQQRRIQSQLYLKYVADAKLIALNNGKKPTEGLINAAINSDDTFIDICSSLNELQANAELMKTLYRAFEQRKDLMQSLSAQKRVEYNIGSNS